MVYFIHGNAERMFQAFGQGELIKNSPNKDMGEIERDFYGRVPFLRAPSVIEAHKKHYLPEAAEGSPKDFYLQGDITGDNLKLLFGVIPLLRIDLEDHVGEYHPVFKQTSAAYVDKENKLSGVSIFYRADIQQWAIVVVKDTHLPKSQREAFVLTSFDPKPFLAEDSPEGFKIDSKDFTATVIADTLGDPIKLPAIETLLKVAVSEDGKINPRTDLFFSLFYEYAHEGQVQDVEADWMETLERRAEEIIKNPLLAELHQDRATAKLLAELSHSQLSNILDSNNEFLATFEKILHDGSIGLPTKKIYLEWVIELDKQELFTDFESIRPVLEFMVKHEDYEELFSDLIEALKDKSVQEDLFSRCKALDNYAQENSNLFISSSAFRYLCKNPKISSEDLKAVLSFLSIPGCEQLDPSELAQFLGESTSDQRKIVAERFKKLSFLEISGKEVYKLAMEDAFFREDVIKTLSDEAGDKEKNKNYVQFALNLKKFDALDKYSELNQDEAFISSFNQFADKVNPEFIASLKEYLKGDDFGEGYKKIIENQLINALLDKSIYPEKEQIAIFVDESHPLTEKLQSIIEASSLQESNKKEAIQSATHLYALGFLNKFEWFPKELFSPFNALASNPENHEALRFVLTPEYFGILQLIGKSDTHLFADIKSNLPVMKDNLMWLSHYSVAQKISPDISSVLIRFLCHQPEIKEKKLTEVAQYLKTPGFEKIEPELLVTFLIENMDNKEVMDAVSSNIGKLKPLNLYKKLDSHAYDLLLSEALFREEVVGKLSDEAGEENNNIAKIRLAAQLEQWGALDQYPELSSDNELVNLFNDYARDIGKLLQKKLKSGGEECKKALRNAQLKTLKDAKVSLESLPVGQLEDILKPESKLSKTIQQLSELPLINPKLAYANVLAWDSGQEFMKVLELFNFKANKNKLAQIIHTLCLVKKEHPDCFKLLLQDEEKRKLFLPAIVAIEDTCFNIKKHLQEEAPDKAKNFSNVEQNYRKNLYGLVFESAFQEQPIDKKAFSASIKIQSQPMFKAVDADRHPWVRVAVATLVNTLSLIFTLGIANVANYSNSGRVFFFSKTESGAAIRDLHQELEETLKPNR